MFISLMLWLVPAAPAALPADAPPTAQKRAKIARQLYRAGDYAAAAREFKVALKLYPGFASLAFNLARSLERAEQTTEAIEAYELYLKLAPEAEDRGEVEGVLSVLRESVGAQKARLRVTSEPSGAQVRVDGELLPDPTPVELSVEPGAHDVEVSLGGVVKKVAAKVSKGKTREVHVPFGAAEGAPVTNGRAEASSSPWPWVACTLPIIL